MDELAGVLRAQQALVAAIGRDRSLLGMERKVISSDAARLYTPAEIADLLQIGKTKIYELLGSGEIESVHIGTRRRIPHDAVLRYIESLRHGEQQ